MTISKELRKTVSKRRHQEAKEDWVNLFCMFCEQIIDSDANDDKLREQVKMASELADLAQEEIEERWVE